MHKLITSNYRSLKPFKKVRQIFLNLRNRLAYGVFKKQEDIDLDYCDRLIQNNDSVSLKDFLSQNTSFNIDSPIKSRENDYLIIKASSLGHIDCLKILIDFGANIHIKNVKNQNALICAALGLHYTFDTNYVTIARELILSGIDIHCISTDGNSAMDYGIFADSTELVKLLLEHNFNVNLCNDKGQTPLITALKLKNKDCLRILLNAGAHLNMHQKDLPIFDLARSLSNNDCVEMLLCEMVKREAEDLSHTLIDLQKSKPNISRL